mmetsp:Transcript_28739/g.70075  ORF Transcript_28739/g.70075 Transcript_28739/m.70075 type:complete len:99 (+) Transcript_28739:473-769(+)
MFIARDAVVVAPSKHVRGQCADDSGGNSSNGALESPVEAKYYRPEPDGDDFAHDRIGDRRRAPTYAAPKDKEDNCERSNGATFARRQSEEDEIGYRYP